MNEPRNLYEEHLTLSCASLHHDICTREDCSCWCHGGVREPRRPKPKPFEMAVQK